MSSYNISPGADKNRLLTSLPLKERENLRPKLNLVHLAKGRVLYQVGDVVQQAYFPLNGLLSLLSLTENGSTIEIAMIGNEGVIGIPAILRAGRMPYQVMVQIPGDAMRIRADALRETFNRSGQFQEMLLRYTHALMTQISQSVVCNHFHKVDARLCRWLLAARDQARSDSFYLTQEFISHMLGIPRTSVTEVASRLQRARLIRYSRGRISILKPQELERLACECYRIIREEIDRSLAA